MSSNKTLRELKGRFKELVREAKKQFLCSNKTLRELKVRLWDSRETLLTCSNKTLRELKGDGFKYGFEFDFDRSNKTLRELKAKSGRT